MRRSLLCIAALTFLFSSLSLAQSTTARFDLFGGYSYLRSNPGGGSESANSSGWEASAGWNWNRWLGFKADLDGHYCCDGQTEHNFLFGPQITVRKSRADFFAHGLIGVSHGTASGFSDTQLAWAIGGGLDLKFKRFSRVGFRVIQADYLGTHYSDSVQNNFRYSTGIVFHIGKK
jgi:outer membrane protein with beta-barrel domain